MKKVFWTFMTCLLITVVSCTEEEPCQSGDLPIKDLEELSCINVPFNVEVATDKEFELIRSQSDYDRLITGTCDATINWNKYDLVIGKVGLSSGLATIKKQLVADCGSNRILLTFTINTNLAASAPFVTFDAIIPKLDNADDFFVSINVID